MQVKKRFLVLFLSLNCCFAISQQPILSANALLQEASATAVKESKHVFVIFHASWCHWCHKMDSAMNDGSIKKFFDNNFVIRHLTILESPNNKHLENPGALDLLKKYNGMDQGIPYWLVFDKKGKLMADSQIRPADFDLQIKGKNCGCPATPEEIAHFLKVLRKTTRLKENELELIGKTFSKITTGEN